MSAVKLSKYEGKCVRVYLKSGEIFEGIAEHDSAEYCFHEFGVDEDALQMENFVLYRRDIKKVESLEGRTGPWGPFSAPFGQLEEAVCDAGADLIDEVFTGEEDVHIVRLLRCLIVRLGSSDAKEIPDVEQLPKLLRDLPSFTENEEALEMAKQLLEKVES